MSDLYDFVDMQFDISIPKVPNKLWKKWEQQNMILKSADVPTQNIWTNTIYRRIKSGNLLNTLNQ